MGHGADWERPASLVSLCWSWKAELEALVGTVTSWLAEGVVARDIRVLAATKRRCEEATQALLAAGIAADHARSSRFQPRAARVASDAPTAGLIEALDAAARLRDRRADP